ncbi:MAG: alpha/beta fold hydrolase [Thermoplasmatota archaeon]
MNGTSLTLDAEGWPIAATWFPGADAAQRSILVIPAMATPQRFYHVFAADLAKRGWGVLTFDPRGTGTSRDGPDPDDATADDWAQRDLVAAHRYLRETVGARHVAVVAHSIGGQLFGMSPIRHDTDSALFVAAQRGMPHLFSGLRRAQLSLIWRIIPATVALFGALPASRFTLPQRVPGPGVKQWARWCRDGEFKDADGRSVEAGFADYKGPLTTVTIEDDQDFAPPRAVEALAACYKEADVRRRTLRPADHGAKRLGHFLPLTGKAPQSVKDQFAAWLEEGIEADVQVQVGTPAK